MTNHTNLIERLKPCPFCGGNRLYRVCNVWLYIRCGNCGAQGGGFAYNDNHVPDAADWGKAFELWNTRANDQAISTLTAEVEELRHKFSMFASHATGGRTSDISLPLNTLSVMASKKVNDAWEMALEKGRAEIDATLTKGSSDAK